MNPRDFEELKEITRKELTRLPEGAYEFELRLQVLVLQQLMQGRPVTPEKLSSIWQMPLDQVQTITAQAASYGTLQMDGQGNLIGSAVSLAPAKINLHTDGHSLYAWCAYDALYAPAVAAATAVIEAEDPLSQEPIRLEVSSGRVVASTPQGVVVTYVGMGADTAGGPDSPRCTQMHFFTSQENAQAWASSRPGVTVLSLRQLQEVIEEFQLEPARRMGLLPG